MQREIGVFDSGVGGLSVLRQLCGLLPDERFHYVADQAYMPYGCKSPELVRERCLAMAEYFVARDAKAIVVACNTATAVAIEALRSRFALPIIGMEPAVKPAVAASRSGVVGVLATRGTVASGKFAALKERFGDQVELIVQPCPGLVECIESGEIEGEGIEALLHGFLDPMLGRRMDTLVLGCTHYPFVLNAIRRIVGRQVAIMDSGEAIARQLRRQLHAIDALAGDGAGAVRLATTDPSGAAMLSRLWGDDGEVAILQI